MHLGDVYRHVPGRLTVTETKLKRVCEESDISWNGQFPDRDAVAFDPKFVEGTGCFHPLMVDQHCSHGHNPEGSRQMECKLDPSDDEEEDEESSNKDENPNECKSMLEENHSESGSSEEGMISCAHE